jgi:hypothetical protein
VGLTTLPCKKKIVEKLPRNSAGFCGGGQGLSWAVEPRKEERKKERKKKEYILQCMLLEDGWLVHVGRRRAAKFLFGDAVAGT